jgi:SAM-dependent methyltransferase
VSTRAGLVRTHASVEAYYSAKIAQFGATPHGVDWTCVATQNLRFVQLLRICDFAESFSLTDFGCGYGALLEFCRERHRRWTIDYVGVDLSARMVAAARSKWAGEPKARFHIGAVSPRTADVCIASGLFNVRQSIGRREWEMFIRETLREMQRTCSVGFSANFMAPLPAGARPEARLYRTTPEPWINFCMQELGCSVRLIEGYGLREFTLLARI